MAERIYDYSVYNAVSPLLYFRSLTFQEIVSNIKEIDHSMKEASEVIAKRMNIADADHREMYPSGTQTKFGAGLFGKDVG